MVDGKHSHEHSITFTEKRWFEGLFKYLRFLPMETPTFIATAISLWAFAQVLTAATHNRSAVGGVAFPILVVSLALAVCRALSRYQSYVPAPLLSESSASRAIFRRQRCGWHLALARQMLSERISRSEATLDRVTRGVAFLEPRHLTGDAHVAWLTTRSDILERLINSVATSCTEDLPAVIARTAREDQLDQLKLEVDALASLYQRAEQFEVDVHAVIPPDQFAAVHGLTLGWSAPIRDGVRQLAAILDELSSIDRTAIKKGTVTPPHFNITFTVPENLRQFPQALNEALHLE